MAVGFRSSSYTPTSGAGNVNGASVSVTRPSGLFVGDVLVAFCARSQTGAATTGFTSSGWTSRGFFPGSSSTALGPVGVLTRTVTSSEAASYTFTSSGFSGNDQFVVHVLAFSGASATNPILVAPALTTAASASSSVIAPSVSMPDAGMLVCWFGALYYEFLFSTSWSPPSLMTERVDRGGNWLHPATYTETRANPGVTGTRNAVYSQTPSERPRAMSLAIRAAGGPPTVSAGANFSAPQLSTLTRTPTENDNNDPITSRAWTVVSGPSQVGATLSTEAELSWKPFMPGTYTLRYTVANSYATATSDVTVTVTVAAHLLTAPMKLTATRVGNKRVSSTRTAPMKLTATRVGRKATGSAHTATVKLRAAAYGAVNQVFAAMKLRAEVSGPSRTGGSAVAASGMKLRAVPGASTSTRGSTPPAASMKLRGSALIDRIISAVRQVIAKPSAAITHELVVVARVPQASGPPTLLEVDSITWSGLSWTDEVSKPQSLNVGCQISSLTEEILQRFRSLADLPTELWLYRNGKLVFAGPLVGGQVQNEGLSLTARGLLYYFDYMVIQRDLVFSQVDQTAMVTDMVNQWQTLDYGHFGIDTRNVSPSGVLRDGTYLAKELHKVGQRIGELGARINGFDISVDPASRQLKLVHPRSGVDRSTGEDAIIFDASNVTSPNIVFSGAAGDVASEAYGASTDSTGSDSLFSHQYNEQLRARFGRTAASGTFDGIKEQGTLDDHTRAMRDVRGEALLVPGPGTRVTPDSDIDSYDVGDTVSYLLHEQLSVVGAYRIRKRQVTAAKTGQEAVSVQFD